MLRGLLGLALVVHGAIHLIGFVVPWRIAEIPGYAPGTTAVWGRLQLGDGGARVLGLAWLAAALAFAFAGVAVAIGAPSAVAIVGVATALSTMLCIAGSPAAVAGLVIDAGIFAVLAAIQLLSGNL